MTSFSLPGRGGSILNDGDAGPSSRRNDARNSAVGSPREQLAQQQHQQLTEEAAEAVASSKRGASAVSRSWRKSTAAASVADAAVGAGATEGEQAAPAIVVPHEGSDPGSADTTPPSTGSGSEDSTGSYFKSMHHPGHRASTSAMRNDSFSYSTSATSIEPSETGSQGGGKLRVPRGTQDRRSPQGERMLNEPGFVTSPKPIGSSPAVASPVPAVHNGPGGHGSALDSHGLTAQAAEQVARRPSLQRKSARSGKLDRDAPAVKPDETGFAVAEARASREASTSHTPSVAPSSSSTSPNISNADAPPARTSSQPLTIGGKKRYPCAHPGCDKTFSTSGHAARHHRIHSGRKPYRCTFPGCKASFSRQDNSLQHYRTHVLHPKGRSGAAAGSLDEDGGSDLNMLQLDAETEASVQLGRKALADGTAIAVVQEVVTRDGKREEAVQRTVGMPRVRRDSTWSEQPLDTDMNDELAFDGPSTRVRSISGSESLRAYSPPAAEYVARAAPTRVSMPQLPHLAASAPLMAPLPYAPSPVHVQHALLPPIPQSLPPAMSPVASYSNHRYAPYAVPTHSSPNIPGQPIRVSTAGLSGVSGLVGGGGRMDAIVSAAPIDSRWSESPLDLLPSHWRGYRDAPGSALPAYAESHGRRPSFSAARDASGTGAEADAANSRAREHSAGMAAMYASPTGHSALSRLPPTSSLGTSYAPLAAVVPPMLPSPQSGLKAPLLARASMRLGGPLPSLTQLPCSSDRSTSCLTPTTPLDSPGFALTTPVGPAARRDDLHLPPMRPQQERR